MMKHHRLNEMIKGWFIGDFSPVAFRSSEMEVGVKAYGAGDREDEHHHKVATELTVVVSGKVRMLGRIWVPGDVVTIEPGESTEFEALQDSVTVVVKCPSVAGDKYPGPNGN